MFGVGATAAASALAAGPAAAGVDKATGRYVAESNVNVDATPSPDLLPLTGGPDFPIGLFWPPHPFASTPERFTEIAEAGFDFVISGNYAGDGIIFQYQLGLARTAGLKMLISDDVQIRSMSRWFSISDNPSGSPSSTPGCGATAYR
ncbi:hypothetical protein GCM10009744_06990 [Kribbella alba]|uniref:Uncharacterized protein n=1 Tax=Kribbella alba TaxID=190197 RepID=A0ABN2F0M2_9ACTN